MGTALCARVGNSHGAKPSPLYGAPAASSHLRCHHTAPSAMQCVPTFAHPILGLSEQGSSAGKLGVEAVLERMNLEVRNLKSYDSNCATSEHCGL